MAFIDPDETRVFKDPDEKRESIGDFYRGTAEAVRALGQGVISSAIQKYLESTGPGRGTREMLGMGPDVLPQKVGRALSYTPSTEAGKEAIDIIATPGRLYGEMAKGAGEAATEVTGFPSVGEFVEKGINVAPYAIGRVPSAGISPSVQAARQAGFKLTPTEPGTGGPISRTATGLSGEARLQRLISQKNQEVVNRKIAQDLGLPPDAPITTEALQTIRSQAGKSYDAVKKTGVIVRDNQYLNDLVKIRDNFAAAAMDFPGAAKTDIIKKLEGISSERFGADSAIQMIRDLREDANGAFLARKNSEGAAYKAMANAMERQVERHLVRTGQSRDLLEKFRAARTLIAKTHDAEDALNAVTGNIRAATYGREAAKGAPLTGGAKEVGEASAAFPRSLRPEGSYMGTGASAGDIALAMANRIASSAPGLGVDILTLGARPAMRSILASGIGQGLMGKAPPQGLIRAGITPGMLEDEERRGLLSDF